MHFLAISQNNFREGRVASQGIVFPGNAAENN
jgi:hypothetical protein